MVNPHKVLNCAVQDVVRPRAVNAVGRRESAYNLRQQLEWWMLDGRRFP